MILVHLTAKGKTLFDSIFPKHAEYVAELASVLKEDEQRDPGRLLKRLGIAAQHRMSNKS